MRFEAIFLLKNEIKKFDKNKNICVPEVYFESALKRLPVLLFCAQPVLSMREREQKELRYKTPNKLHP